MSAVSAASHWPLGERMLAPEPWRRGFRTLALPLATLAVVFAADLVHATHLTPAVLYPIAVLLTIGSRHVAVTRGIAVLAALLTIVGRLVPRNEPSTLMDLTNRVVTVLALWSVAALVRHLNRSQQRLATVEKLNLAEHIEREQTQQKLDVSLHELRDMKAALDRSSIVSTTDLDGKILYVNDKFCHVSGYRREELLGRNHRVLNSGLHPELFWRDLWQTIGSGRTWRGEVRNKAKDGTFWWADTTIVALGDGENRPRQYVAIRSDITARKLAEEKLVEQTAMVRLGEMASVVAHEVRNPLAGVSGALQILRERMAPDSEERRIMSDVLTRVDQLNASLSDLLLYARPGRVCKAPVQIRHLLEEVRASCRLDPRFADVAVTVEGEGAVCALDENLIRGAVLNLALNAAQAMKAGGTVHLIAGKLGYRGRITVADNGPGIAPHIRERIFEPFFTTKVRGTGLGLPTVKRVMEQHGGEVSVDCPEQGGTRVHLDFPP